MHVQSISAQTRQERIQCTKAIELLMFYCPNIYCAPRNAWALAFGAAEIEFKEIHENHYKMSCTAIIQPILNRF